MRFGVDGVKKQVVRRKMVRILKVFGNDNVESTFAAGNIGKERQKILKITKQLSSMFFLPSFLTRYRKLSQYSIPVIDVEQRTYTSASHLSGRDIDDNSVDIIPKGYWIGVTDEIGLPQIKKMMKLNFMARIIDSDSFLLVLVK